MTTIDLSYPHAPERGHRLKDYILAYGSSWFWYAAPIFAISASIKAPGEWQVLLGVVGVVGGVAFLGGALSGVLLCGQIDSVANICAAVNARSVFGPALSTPSNAPRRREGGTRPHTATATYNGKAVTPRFSAGSGLRTTQFRWPAS